MGDQQRQVYEVPDTLLHPSAEMLDVYLSYYGFDYFLKNTMSRIDMNNKNYADLVDSAFFERPTKYDDTCDFSLNKAFNTIVTEMREDDGLTLREALEHLAEDDYVMPVNTAMLYSINAGEMDIERLSVLIRNRATRLLDRMDREES